MVSSLQKLMVVKCRFLQLFIEENHRILLDACNQHILPELIYKENFLMVSLNDTLRLIMSYTKAKNLRDPDQPRTFFLDDTLKSIFQNNIPEIGERLNYMYVIRAIKDSFDPEKTKIVELSDEIDKIILYKKMI